MPHSETLIPAPRYCHESVLATAPGNGRPVQSHDPASLATHNVGGATTGPAHLKDGSLRAPSRTRPPPKTPSASTSCTNFGQNTDTTLAAFSPTPPLPLAQRNLNSLNARSTARTSNDDINRGLKKGIVAENDPDTAPSAVPFSAVQAAVDEALITSIEPHRGCCCHKQQQRTHPQLAWQGRDKGAAERRHKDEVRGTSWAAQLAQLQTETDRILAQQQRRDMERRQRLELQLSGGRPLPPLPASESSPLPSPKTRSPVLEKISLHARGRRLRGTGLLPTSTNSLRSAASASVSPTSSAGAGLDTNPPNKPQPMSTMNFIEAGGRGHTDAPRGASNGGERRVAVRCRGAALDLLVGAETTAYDILVASSKQTIQTFNVKTSTLTECYAELGLERRIRRYERIRDILNSWDQDTQHSLVVSPDLLMPSNDLDLASVPHTDKPPSGFILSLYHLQKPRKWSKRYITLLEGGQLVLSKKLEPGPSDRDCVNLCHLSDFDIYVPIEAQKRKQLKPPKKHCYAVKSQQKAAVFQRHENYVHYFCTDDPDVGQEFFDGVHAWRSWYIANRVLELFTEKKKVTPENPPQILPDKPSSPKKSVGHVKVNGHRVKVSVDESPYAIGRFEPLINLQRFEKPLEEFGNDWVPDPRRSVPPQSAPSTGNSEANGDARKDLSVNMPERGQGAFEEGGLLGAAYDKRKQAQRDGNRRSQMSDKASPVPFTEGRSLLNDRRSSSATASTTTNTRPPVSPSSTEKSADSKRSSDKAESSGWFPSAIEHSAKTRPVAHRPNIPSSPGSHNERDQYGRHYYQNPQLHANRRPPQPLVDLTPSFIEPPQWSRQGAGRGYRVPEGKPLVDFATGPPVSSSRGYEPPPRALVRRGDAGSIHSNSSAGTASQRQGSSGGLGRRQTVRSDRPPVSSSGRLMGQYDQNRGPLLSFPNGENRGRSFTSSSGPPLGMGGGQMRSSPASSVVASEREVRRTGRERSGTLA